jgi:hypothetical protein
MSYAGKIEELIAERDELRATLTAVSDALDYLHGMTPQQAAALRKDAERYRWLRAQHWNTGQLCVVAEPKDAVKLGHCCPSGEHLDIAVDDAMLIGRAVGAA